MALIRCPECGKEFSEMADKSPNCGRPNPAARKTVAEVSKGKWSSGRLAIGIISIVLFVLIGLQSCAVGVGNTLEDNGATSGSSGMGMAFYWLAALLTIGTGDSYPDLPIWGVIAFLFGVVFLIAGIKTKKS